MPEKTEINPGTHHPRTGAKRADTPETATPRPAPSVAQVLVGQRPEQTIDGNGNITKAGQLPAVAPTQTPRVQVSDEAFERNLAEWGGGAGTPLTHNGMDNHFQTSGSQKVDVADIIFIAHMDETRKEIIKFNGEGVPPTIISVGVYENATLPERETLGDLDPGAWPIDRYKNEPVDPWQRQFRVPLVSTAADGAIYELTSRSPTSQYAFRDLLNRYGRHPQRKKKLVPLIRLVCTTYLNKKLGTQRPKPRYDIVGWVQKDGSPPLSVPSNRITTSGEVSDEIPF
jgi:hypothetical protein